MTSAADQSLDSAHTIARGMMLDRITDESGRRLRDSRNPGSGVLSRATMDRMRAQSYRVGK